MGRERPSAGLARSGVPEQDAIRCPPVASVWSSQLKPTQSTARGRQRAVPRGWPVAAFQSLSLPSPPPVASVRPSQLNDKVYTPVACASIGWPRGCELAASQSRSLPSRPPEASDSAVSVGHGGNGARVCRDGLPATLSCCGTPEPERAMAAHRGQRSPVSAVDDGECSAGI